MNLPLLKRAQARIVIGMGSLAFAATALTTLHSDFLGGLGFGFGMPLIGLGIIALRRN